MRHWDLIDRGRWWIEFMNCWLSCLRWRLLITCLLKIRLRMLLCQFLFLRFLLCFTQSRNFIQNILARVLRFRKFETFSPVRACLIVLTFLQMIIRQKFSSMSEFREVLHLQRCKAIAISSARFYSVVVLGVALGYAWIPCRLELLFLHLSDDHKRCNVRPEKCQWSKWPERLTEHILPGRCLQYLQHNTIASSISSLRAISVCVRRQRPEHSNNANHWV